jgi:hypothetical protein
MPSLTGPGGGRMCEHCVSGMVQRNRLLDVRHLALPLRRNGRVVAALRARDKEAELIPVHVASRHLRRTRLARPSWLLCY